MYIKPTSQYQSQLWVKLSQNKRARAFDKPITLSRDISCTPQAINEVGILEIV